MSIFQGGILIQKWSQNAGIGQASLSCCCIISRLISSPNQRDQITRECWCCGTENVNNQYPGRELHFLHLSHTRQRTVLELYIVRVTLQHRQGTHTTTVLLNILIDIQEQGINLVNPFLSIDQSVQQFYGHCHCKVVHDASLSSSSRLDRFLVTNSRSRSRKMRMFMKQNSQKRSFYSWPVFHSFIHLQASISGGAIFILYCDLKISLSLRLSKYPIFHDYRSPSLDHYMHPKPTLCAHYSHIKSTL